MDHPDVRRLATANRGIAARWQLPRDLTGSGGADWALRDLRRPFAGVCVTGWAPISERQRWHAATLTAPETHLSFASAGGFWRVRRDPGHFVTVTRPGSRGPSRYGDLLVSYSRTLPGNVVVVDGIPVTTIERTLIDLWPLLGGAERTKMVREALRRELTTLPRMLVALHGHRRRRGVASLRRHLLERSHLPFDRCRSDAEAYGLVVLDLAGVQIPEVNRPFAGLEADFCWPDRREIVEIDGPQWHRFAEEDARKTVIWTAAGFRVRRIGSELVFSEPSELLRLAPPPSALRLERPEPVLPAQEPDVRQR